MKGHLSNIKCLDTVIISDNEVLLISGGGRAHLKVWRLCLLGDGDVVYSEYGEHILLGGCGKAVKQPWRQVQSQVRPDPETRLMCLTIQKSLAKESLEMFRIYVGCSDSVLRGYNFSLNKKGK